MKNLKARFAALLILTTIALTFIPTASAATAVARPCPGAVGLALCVVDESYCLAWYLAFGSEPAGCKSEGGNVLTTVNGQFVDATQ